MKTTPTHTVSVTSLWQDLLVKWSDKERAEHVGSGTFTQPDNAASFFTFSNTRGPALPVTGLLLYVLLNRIQTFSSVRSTAIVLTNMQKSHSKQESLKEARKILTRPLLKSSHYR